MHSRQGLSLSSISSSLSEARWVQYGPQSPVCDTDLRGLSLKAQGNQLLNLDSDLASPGRGALRLSLPGWLHLPLFLQLVVCLGMLVLEVGAVGTVYTLGMTCTSLLTLWCDSSRGLRGFLCSACPHPQQPSHQICTLWAGDGTQHPLLQAAQGPVAMGKKVRHFPVFWVLRMLTASWPHPHPSPSSAQDAVLPLWLLGGDVSLLGL